MGGHAERAQHVKFRKRHEKGGVYRPCRKRVWKMPRLVEMSDAVSVCAFGFVVYKAVELGPYDAAVWFGRCFHAFVAAALGYA